MIIAGDVGGTKAVIALFEPDGGGDGAGALRAVREETYPCAQFPSLEAILGEFLRQPPPTPIAAGSFGVAGPVTGQVAKITNVPWTIDARALSAGLGGAPVSLLNDLQATALGVLHLPPEAFAVLKPGAHPVGAGTLAVIAPGTGLGEAILWWDGARYHPLASEGGHADFAPGTDLEIELLRFLRARHGEHVSYERVLSGDGIGDLYRFLRASGPAEPAWLTAKLAVGDRNATISEVGMAGQDPVCARALAMFAAILGAEAGNLALRGLAEGGVVIGGGIPPKILPALQAGGLVARFLDKGRFAGWLGERAVRVALEPRAALIGAAHAAVAPS